MFTAMACILLGLVIGAVYGNKLFKPLKDQTVTVQRLDLRYDYIDTRTVPDNHGKPVSDTMRMVLGYAPEWVKWPDYERTLWANHTISMLWPQYNAAIGKMVLEMAQPYIDEYKKQYSWLTAVFLHRIDLGTFPMAIAGFKIYQTADDEVILESAIQWGSNANAKASARVTFAGYTVELPVQVFNIMAKAKARITIKPLVDIIPCMGAVNVTLIDQPEIDFSVRALGSCDLMAIPGIRQVALFFVGKIVRDMIVYPSDMTFPIMENSGIPPPPQGMLRVKLLKGIHLTGGTDLFSKIDPFVEISVRENRIIRSKTIWNNENPEWNEELKYHSTPSPLLYNFFLF
ncbi:hypothetical protein WJX84_009997 [Apatococcus fuscideae]|uniref:C2 domain-containing protein n=1 Tax=Apatococcus fuscideae TaxID=2026836 RepID=A0AAW1T7P2_9CHLO